MVEIVRVESAHRFQFGNATAGGHRTLSFGTMRDTIAALATDKPAQINMTIRNPISIGDSRGTLPDRGLPKKRVGDYARTQSRFYSTSGLQPRDSGFNVKNVSNCSNRRTSSAADLWSWLVKPRVVDQFFKRSPTIQQLPGIYFTDEVQRVNVRACDRDYNESCRCALGGQQRYEDDRLRYCEPPISVRRQDRRDTGADLARLQIFQFSLVE
jgi:hypothetical protein